MSTPENPETPALTRRQLRELRQTGATPIIVPQPEGEAQDAVTPDAVTLDAVAPDAESADAAVRTTPIDEASEVIDAVPEADENTPPDADAVGFATGEAAVQHSETVDAQKAPSPDERSVPAALPSGFAPLFSDEGGEFGVSGLTRRQVREQEKIRTAAVPIISSDLERSQPASPAPAPRASDEPVLPAIFRPSAPDVDDAPAAGEQATSVVNPALGSDLLEGATPDITLPASFDQLIGRGVSATGAVSTPNALILSQTPTGVPLVGPMTGTGEIMITGSFDLPEGLGSVGHAPGTTDGHDADAVLLDGELPPASSPTPIAASAAISTIKQPGEIIRPPAPEKGSKLLVGLIVTVGALALLVAVSLGLAITTGVFR